MARRYDYEPPELEVRYGSSESYSDDFQDEYSIGDDWLLANDPSLASERAINGEIEGLDLNGATAADFQLHRIQSMSYGIQANIKSALLGTLDGSKRGINRIDIDVATEDFSKITGISSAEFARRIKLPEGQNPSMHPEDLRTALSMIGDTAGTKMEAGPGYSLPGNYLDPERQAKAEERLTGAFRDISAVAEYYMTDATKGSSIYGVRKRAIEEALTKRVMDMPFHSSSRSIVPMPNEIGIMGVVPTMGNYSNYTDERGNYQGGGTPYTRLEFANIEGELVEGSPMWNTLNPNAKRSLVPIKIPSKKKLPEGPERDALIADLKAQQSAEYETEIYGRLQNARAVLREQFPSMSDESQGQGRMTAYQQSQEDWDAIADARNEAAIDGLDMHAPEDFGSGMAMPRDITVVDPITGKITKKPFVIPAGQGLGGSQTGGMYGEKGLSEVDKYVEPVTDYGYVAPVKFATYDFPSDSARAEYITKQMTNPSAVQGSKEWLAQRKGKVTASVTEEFGYERGVDRVAANLAAERLGYGDKWRGNAYTSRGTRHEKDALKSFLAQEGKGLSYEEAYFETDPSQPGFGVSPDGRLYNSDGDTEGLLELKVLSNSMMKGAVAKYTPQMQMQMAITGESQTHFYALDAETGEYQHQVIAADPEMQADLIKQGNEAMDIAAGLDLRGVRDLDKDIKQSGRKKIKPDGGKPAGQEAKFTPPSGEKPMEVFNAMTTVGGKSIRVETGLEDDIAGLEAFMEGFGSGGGRDDGADANGMKEFMAATKNAAKALVAFGAILSKGAETGFSEMQLANEAGMDTGEVRGIRSALEGTGMTAKGIDRSIAYAGQLTRDMNNKATVANTYSKMITNIKASDLPGVQAMHMPGVTELMAMSPQESLAWMVSAGEGMTKEERSYLYTTVFNAKELALNNSVTGETIGSAYEGVPEAGLIEQRLGKVGATQEARRQREATASLGKNAGQLEAIAEIVSENLTIPQMLATGTAGAALLIDKYGEDIMSGNIWNIINNHNSSKVTPGEALARPEVMSASPDSSIKGYKQLDGDTPIPNSKIDQSKIPNVSGTPVVVENYVNMSTEVTRDGVKTQATVNDDLYIDEDTGTGTGD